MHLSVSDAPSVSEHLRLVTNRRLVMHLSVSDARLVMHLSVVITNALSVSVHRLLMHLSVSDALVG